MAEVQQPVAAPSTPPQWDMDLIFFVLSDPSRRRMLLSLAKNGPQTAEKLHVGIKLQVTRTLKQLATMLEAGLIVKKENPADRRKPLYFVSTAIPLTTTETGVFLDFGFCNMRF